MISQRIRYFLTAAREGSFVKAARQMYVSSQGLTRQIRQLEEELGGALFLRSTRGVVLTDFGQEAYRRFVRIDQEMTQALAELKALAADNKKEIHIGIFSALPQENLVTPMVSFFLAAFSAYQINLNLVELDQGRRLMREGKLDLLLTNTHDEDAWAGRQMFCLNEHTAQVIVSLYHPWALKTEITREDMAGEIFLKMKMDGDHYHVPREESFYENIPCRERQEVDNFHTLLALLQQGEAFAVFPKAFSYMDQAKMKYFDYPGQTFGFYTAMIYNPDLNHGEIDQAVAELAEEFEMREKTV